MAALACAVAIVAGVLTAGGASPAGTGGLPPPVDAPATGASAGAVGAGEAGGGKSAPSAKAGKSAPSAGAAEADGGDARQPSDAAGVPEAAADLVREYEQRGDCVLVRSGYLDLSGRVWSMVVEGSGWVDVCIVQSSGDGTGKAKVMHMDAAEWAASLGELGLGG